MKEILITSSVLIGVILLARLLFRGKVSQKLIYAAWLLVALRLLIPIQFGQSQYSITTLTKMIEAQSKPLQQMQQVMDQPVAGPSRDELYDQLLDEYFQQNPELPKPETPDQITPEAQQQIVEQADQLTAPSLSEVLASIWIVGICAMASWFLTANLIFLHRAKKGSTLFPDCNSRVPVWVSPNVPTPCLVGFFRPVIYLTPASIENEQALRHVLTHELTHLHHADHIWALVRCICLCIYWFDPLVWIAASQSRRDCELACDEGALKKLGDHERVAYGQTLIATVTQSLSPAYLIETATSMNETKKQLKERVTFIAKKPKTLLIAAVCMVLVAALTAGCVFMGAKEQVIDPAVQKNSWEIPEKMKTQIKQEYINYMAPHNYDCTTEDVNLIVVSHVESGYVVIIGCKCGSINPNAPWTDVHSSNIDIYEFFMPSEWFMQFYTDGSFNTLDAAYNLQQITKKQVKSVWSDYYAQFPQAWDFYKQRYPDGAPDPVEEDMLKQYRSIVAFLHKFDWSNPNSNNIVDLETWEIYRSQEAVRFCYRWLTETTEVDEWTEYCRQHWEKDYEYDRQTILRDFSVIKDVQLQANRYEKDPTRGYILQGRQLWQYDSKDRLFYKKLDHKDPLSMLQYIPANFQSGDQFVLYYDENDRIDCLYDGSTLYLPNYDASGKLSSMTLQMTTKVRLIQYTYDAADRLIRVELSGDTLPSSNYLVEYSYDADGNLAKRVQTYYTDDPYDHTHTTVKVSRQEIMEYHYDRQGVLQTASYTVRRFVKGVTYDSQDEYTFYYDKHGRMVRYDIVYDDMDHTTGYVEIIYGDFLYYSA